MTIEILKLKIEQAQEYQTKGCAMCCYDALADSDCTTQLYTVYRPTSVDPACCLFRRTNANSTLIENNKSSRSKWDKQQKQLQNWGWSMIRVMR